MSNKLNVISMGLFGFIGEIASATVKVVATPIAVVADIASIATGNEADNTKDLIKSIGSDLSDSIEEISGEKF